MHRHAPLMVVVGDVEIGRWPGATVEICSTHADRIIHGATMEKLFFHNSAVHDSVQENSPRLTRFARVSTFCPQRHALCPECKFGDFYFTMANTILVGAQWSDEGKGKIIDVLTEQADVV